MARKRSKAAVEAQTALEQFFAGNSEAFALAYSPENLAANIVQAAQYGGWSDFAELLTTVQLFTDLSLEQLSKHIYVGAYQKCKALGTAAERVMNEEYLRESGNHPELSRTAVYDRMHSSSRQHAIIERGESGQKFAATKTPKVE